MGNRTVTLVGNDITDKITEIPTFTKNAGEFGQLIISDINQLKGNNIRGFWDPQNPASPFFGVSDYSQFDIQIDQDGIRVFDGSVLSISSDNDSKTASIQIQSKLNQSLNQGIIFASQEEDTPSTVALKICEQYQIPVNSASFGASSAIYSADEIVISAYYFSPNGSVLEALQQIAAIGVARIYNDNNNLLNFDVYQQRTTNPIYTFSDKSDNTDGITVWSNPIIETIEKEPIHGYDVKWAGTPSAVYGSSIDNGKSISAGYENPVRIMTLQSAVWIGERWMSYLNKSQRRITFNCPLRLGKSMEIGYPIAIDYSNWRTITLDIVGIDNSDRASSTIIGVTR